MRAKWLRDANYSLDDVWDLCAKFMRFEPEEAGRKVSLEKAVAWLSGILDRVYESDPNCGGKMKGLSNAGSI